jgi:hypothetical protein
MHRRNSAAYSVTHVANPTTSAAMMAARRVVVIRAEPNRELSIPMGGLLEANHALHM